MRTDWRFPRLERSGVVLGCVYIFYTVILRYIRYRIIIYIPVKLIIIMHGNNSARARALEGDEAGQIAPREDLAQLGIGEHRAEQRPLAQPPRLRA